MFIKFEIPFTACNKTSSAFLKVSNKGVRSADIVSNF